MNKNKLVNNQYRKQEFNKRRKFRGAESFCKSNGDCPIFQNCLLEIDQLTNNWNELEEWLKSYIALIANPDTLEEQTLEDLKEVLDKMKEIKEGNNVSSRN